MGGIVSLFDQRRDAEEVNDDDWVVVNGPDDGSEDQRALVSESTCEPVTSEADPGCGTGDGIKKDEENISPQSNTSLLQTDPTVQHILPGPAVQCLQPASHLEPNLPMLQAQPDSTVNQAQSDSTVNQAQSDSTVNQAQSDSAVEQAQSDSTVNEAQSDSTVNQAQSDSTVNQAQSDSTVNQAQSDSAVNQAQSDSTVEQAQSDSAVNQAQSDSAVEQAQSDSAVEQAQPDSTVNQAQSDSTVNQAQSDPAVEQAQSDSAVEQAQPDSTVNQVQPDSTVDKVQPDSVVKQLLPDSAVEQAQSDSTIDQAQFDSTVDQAQSDSVVKQLFPDSAVEQVLSAADTFRCSMEECGQSQASQHGAECADSENCSRKAVDPRRAKEVAATHALQTESYSLSKHIDPHAVSSALYARKMISSDDVERAQTKAMGTERQRAHSLIMTVIRKVDQKPSLFEGVCDILKAEGVSVKKLKREYQNRYDELTKDTNVDRDFGGARMCKSLEAQKSDSGESETRSETGSSDNQSLSVDTRVVDGCEGPALLQQAIKSGSFDEVRRILESNEAGIDGTIVTKDGETFLHLALNHGDFRIFTFLLGSLTDVDVNAQDKKGITPLHAACLAAICNAKTPEEYLQRKEHEGVISNLLKYGAKVDTQDEEGRTSLHVACQTCDVNIVEILLSRGTESVVVKDKNGDTPLHIASDRGALDVVRVLLQHKAYPHTQNKSSYTPLHLACLQQRVEVAELLVRHDPSTVDGIDQHRNTSLHFACDKNDAALVSVLLKCKRCQVYKHNADGFTPLHLTSSRNNSDVVKQLIKCCPRPSRHGFVNDQCRDGDTALHIACRSGFESVVSVLKKYNARSDIKNQADKTPADVAKENQHQSTFIRCVARQTI